MITADYDLNGNEYTIEEKISSMSVGELKDFLSYCATNKTFPSLTSLKNHLFEIDKDKKLIATAKWLISNDLFGDIHTILKAAQDLAEKLDNCGCSECSHSTFEITNWFNEYLRNK